MYAYVGSRTTRARNARGEGISVFRFDPLTGALNLLQVVGDLINPSYLALHPKLPVLYTVHGDSQEISSFHVSRETGLLRFQSRQSCEGKNPVHLALDPTSHFMVVSNHITSSLAVLPIETDGSLRPVTQLLPLEGTPGPHRKEQPFAKPHFNPFDPSGRFVLVPDKGLDKVFVFGFEHGRLAPAPYPELICREGSGPRHLAFHPKQPWVYIINELDNTVTACVFDASTGQLQAFQIISSLSDSFTGNSRASEIEIDPTGRVLFASNRGEDSIAVMRIDTNSGRLQLQQTLHCRPDRAEPVTPRFFTIDPSGQWLLVLGEDSDEILSYAMPSASLLMQPAAQKHSCASPVCMVLTSFDASSETNLTPALSRSA
jgi:6-phosphogluconolactonase